MYITVYKQTEKGQKLKRFTLIPVEPQKPKELLNLRGFQLKTMNDEN